MGGRTAYCASRFRCNFLTVPIVTATATQILAANPNRWGFLLTCSAQASTTLSFGQPLIGQNGHIFLGSSGLMQPLWLCVDEIGPAVWEVIFACNTISGGQNVGIVEVVEIG